ncbi:MAG TPA: hypothetical protein VEC12_09295, partial [Bacteroidia bacterium]|nr:hypothetical protein [Bacteroidia bacterium]
QWVIDRTEYLTPVEFTAPAKKGRSFYAAIHGKEGFDGVADFSLGLGGLIIEGATYSLTGGASGLGVAFSADQLMAGINKISARMDGTYDSKKTYEPIKAILQEYSNYLKLSPKQAGDLYDAASILLSIKTFSVEKYDAIQSILQKSNITTEQATKMLYEVLSNIKALDDKAEELQNNQEDNNNEQE